MDTYKLVDSTQLDKEMLATANALREKGGTEDKIPWETDIGFRQAILDLETGSATAPITIRVVTSNDSVISPTITITNTYDGTVFQEFACDTETVVKIPAGMPYRIDAGQVDGYSVPESVEGLAIAGEARTVELFYAYGRRYGFRRKKAESSPSARIEYLYDAVGMTPMSVDQSTGEPNYGSWKSFVDEICRPVMIKYDGTIDYELDHSDQTKKLDGTASDIANTSYGGNAMVEFRKFKWVHRSEDSTYEYVIFSDQNFWEEESYNAYAHTNENGEIQEAFYWGMFEGTYSNSRLRSIGTGSIMVSQTASTEISRATANGSGYYTGYKSGWDYIADILTLIGKSDDAQSVFGIGHQSGSVLTAGQFNAKPAFYGSPDAAKAIKCLYIENMWGNCEERTAGFHLIGGTGMAVKMTPPYNLTGSGYHKPGVNFTNNSVGDGYISANICTDAAGFVPKTLSGSNTTYVCSGMYWATYSNAVYAALLGGACQRGGYTGLRACDFAFSASGDTREFFTARLTYIKP